MDSVDNYYEGDMYEKDPSEITFRADYVEFNPPHTESKYEQVKGLIAVLGQQKPILILEGECIDGRHRTRIAEELDRKVLCVNVREGIDPKELILLTNLDSLGSRSYSTAQRAINAYKLVKKFGYKQNEAARLCGTSAKFVTYVKSIVKYGFEEVIEELEKGNKVMICDMQTGSSSVEYLCKVAKAAYEKDKVIVDTSQRVQFDPEAAIRTESGKAWYYDKINTLGIAEDYGLNAIIRQDYAELANYKYSSIS